MTPSEVIVEINASRRACTENPKVADHADLSFTWQSARVGVPTHQLRPRTVQANTTSERRTRKVATMWLSDAQSELLCRVAGERGELNARVLLEIGVALTSFGGLFMLLGVMLFFDGSLLALGNVRFMYTII